MPGKCLLLLAGLFYFDMAGAQQPSGGISMRGKYGNEISISDVNGRPFESAYKDVNGHPFFNESFSYAFVHLVNGRNYEHIKARLDICTNQVNFMQPDNQEFYIPAGLVKSIFFTDSSQPAYPSYFFQSGFPVIDNHSPASFYQVLSEGKYTLLKLISKSLKTTKNDLSGETTKEFDTYEDYYLFANGEMKRLKNGKDFMLPALPGMEQQVNQFIRANKINFKKTADLIKLFTFYNSLN